MLWVDTDFGFDDLWALLMLERAGLALDGVSLVAGNATLPQVTSNALGAVKAYGLTFPLYGGAAKPLVREPETAASVLGPTAIQTRGQLLPIFEKPAPPANRQASNTRLAGKWRGKHGPGASGSRASHQHRPTGP